MCYPSPVLSLLLTLAAIGALLWSSFPSQAAAGQAPAVQPAVYWSTADGKTQVTLVAEGGDKYRLIVISNGKLNVTYHTKRNSTIPVNEKLTPIASATPQVQQYRFSHHFSRSTSWMGLSFTENGKPVHELTRVFSGDINKSVPSDNYLPKANR